MKKIQEAEDVLLRVAENKGDCEKIGGVAEVLRVTAEECYDVAGRIEDSAYSNAWTAAGDALLAVAGAAGDFCRAWERLQSDLKGALPDQ